MYENYSVLFVDDEENILSSLKRGLMDEEYTCYFASSGKEALRILENTKVSVIVSDMRMPEMDGLKLLREVEGKYPRVVKIILSGYTQLTQVLAVINQVDIFKFITKPWKLEEEFKGIIHKSLNYYKIQEENEEIKKALQSKNQAYINILKNIEETVTAAKKRSDILGECGRWILSFNRRIEEKEIYTRLLPVQEKIFELFSIAIKGDEKDVLSESLLNEIIESVEVLIPVTKVDMKQSFIQKLKVYPQIIVALFLSNIYLLEDQYKKNGLYINAAENNLKCPTVTFICPKDNSDKDVTPQEAILLDVQIDFLNMVLSKVAAINEVDYKVIHMDGNIITILTLNMKLKQI